MPLLADKQQPDQRSNICALIALFNNFEHAGECAYEPAGKKAIKDLNTHRRGRAVENPQKRKSEMAAPTVLSWIAVVVWKRSINILIEIVLKTPAALTRGDKEGPD